MSEIARRYDNLAGQFTRRVEAVGPAEWDAPTPCAGWTTRDVVGHLTEWIPAFCMTRLAIELPDLPPVDQDPAASWRALDAALRQVLADPEVAQRPVEVWGTATTVEGAVGQFFLGDILVHTWDVARAAGLDETLDPHEVHLYLVGMEPLDERLRQTGHFGPRVPVPDDADEQTRLIAFTGRQPSWAPPAVRVRPPR